MPLRGRGWVENHAVDAKSCAEWFTRVMLFDFQNGLLRKVAQVLGFLYKNAWGMKCFKMMPPPPLILMKEYYEHRPYNT